ncbi:hypothetical protein HNP21_005521 [Bacillus aryabhattai]|uniref:Uncharacterized protein n=1 Tax=Priestia aryabhattai TaxID=412384 RepID=A0A7W3NG80_PRIAR|nr:hypothetical protein [Priestia aryabhattai]MBA9042386.1 hypothetical protein [Priestia aryabhattai]
MKVLNKLYPETTKEMKELLKQAKGKKLTKEQALKTLFITPEFLDPLLFLFFILDNKINELISYENYALYMRNKGIQSRNKNLILIADEALEIHKQTNL